jgi:hypothetical protein
MEVELIEKWYEICFVVCGVEPFSYAAAVTDSGWWWSCRWGETSNLKCVHQRACCSSPMWYMSLENHAGIISTGENSWFVRQISLANLPAESSSGKAGGTGEGNEFGLTNYIIHTLKGSYMGPTTLLSLQTKACCGFVSPWAGLEPANLGSSGKHSNRYTIEDDLLIVVLWQYALCTRDGRMWTPTRMLLL